MVGGAAAGENPSGVGWRENVAEGFAEREHSQLFREELQSKRSKNWARGA